MDMFLCDFKSLSNSGARRRYQSSRSLKKMFMNSLIIAFIILSVVGAADDNDGNNNFDDSPNLDVQQPDTEAIARSTEVGEKAENAEQTAAEQKEGKDDFLAGSLGKPKFTITSITPAHGPITGDTKITVRGGPFAKYSLVYTEPKCRFGNNTLIVGATYVSCTVKARNWDEKEAKKAERSDTCVQCEGSPPTIESKPVEFTISLTGDFTDVGSSATFYYYKPPKVKAIKPIHGPKDGGTSVQVWGDNFVNYGDLVTCSFGTKAVKATVHDVGYITCNSPPSDVVQRGMPFGISLNGQQQTKDAIDYWYYNAPQVTVAEPASGPGPGPESGGNEVIVRGNNFYPFHPDQAEPEIANSTRCGFTNLNVWMPATILNSTRAVCIAPPSYYYRQTPVEITLNAQQWTDDGTLYYYYKPPFLFDVDPKQGPLMGGTGVTLMGTNFNKTNKITCKFGTKEVPAELKSSSEIYCVAPPGTEPGLVDLSISLIPGLYSASVKYLYYQTPTVTQVYPTSGPEYGFTQLYVQGTNFIDLGGDSAVCVFNNSIHTNATVMSDTEIICDSPSLLNKQGYLEIPEGASALYQLKISLEAGKRMSESYATFKYYKEPTITKVSPALGPLRAGTTVTMYGTGFGQEQAHERIVSVGHMQVQVLNYTNTSLTFQAPVVPQPSTTVLGLSLNGQQFTDIRPNSVHDPAQSVTFDYYRDPYSSVHSPVRGPTNGGTPIKVQGFGFELHRPHLKDRLWARFVDPSNPETVLAPATEVEKHSIDAFEWKTPAVKSPQDALLQISLNNQDWHNVIDPADTKSFTYYNAPHITSISPTFGHVKSTTEQIITLKGTNFECFGENCEDLKCRFGNTPETYIYVPGQLVDSTTMKCKVPVYTKPDVLDVEMTINDESYTSDNQTFGFFDPFVLDANPRLIAVDGSTKVTIDGIGFVNSGQTKSLYSNRTAKGFEIVCGGTNAECSKPAQFVDKRTLVTSTFAQNEVKYKSNGKSVMWDPVLIDATVIGDEYTQNDIKLYYYQDPTFTQVNINESPSNIESNLIINADFGSQDKSKLIDYAKPKCRFSSSQGKVQETSASLLRYPFTTSKDPKLINAVHCKTPQWALEGTEPEKVTLDVSINGQNYKSDGGLDFTFLRPLVNHRDVPMSGPLNTQTKVRTIGTGYKMTKNIARLKWGTLTADPVSAAEISEYTYTEQGFLGTIAGSQELKAYFTETGRFKKVDSEMTEGGAYYETAVKPSLMQCDAASQGGPGYLEMGTEEKLLHTVTLADGTQKDEAWTIYNFPPQAVEFYTYKVPTVLKMHPASGLIKGGTFVEVIGTWFKYLPEYGVIPHCRFGDKIVRAHFDSTVRLICQSPPGIDTQTKFPFEVSLNGVDWSKTGFTYSYYDQPIMTDITPDMGSVNGGDTIYIKGDKFSPNVDPNEFKCRFTPTTMKIPPRHTKASFINVTTISCPSPGGWSEADRMILQVTQNGVDYDENNFIYSYYSIHRAFPRSGPSNGKGGDIVIYGAGFHTETNPACMLNGTKLDPTFVNSTQIRCPMPPAEGGDSVFQNVELNMTANGITWHNFEGGFQYYEQPIVQDIDPKRGPSSGVGIINFYGSGFRADYPLAELGCRLGASTGKAYYVSAGQIKCVVEDIPLLAEDEDALPAQASLNSYSYTELSEDTYYRPYGILAVSPSSVPIGAQSTLIVTGKGFVTEEGVTARCRFGTPASYAITEAEILSYSRLACRSPEKLPINPTTALPRDVPFSIAMSGDEFAPWTKTPHRMVFYSQPQIASIDPDEVDVGRVASVTILASDDSDFFDPVSGVPPANGQPAIEFSLSPIKCKFGRFGETQGVFINTTAIKCTTPATDESPDSIYRETVTVSVAMNGQDYLEDQSDLEFTFVGTAPYISFLTILFLIVAVAFVGLMWTWYISTKNNYAHQPNPIPSRNVSRQNFGNTNRAASSRGLRDPNPQINV